MSASANDYISYYNLRTTLSDSEVNTPPGSGWSIADTGWGRLSFGNWVTMHGGNTGKVRITATNSDLELSASSVTTEGATLTLTSGGLGYTGNWWYKQTSPNDSVCALAGSSSVAVTGLLPGRDYTYAVYDNEKCHPSDNALYTGTFTTLYALRADGLL